MLNQSMIPITIRVGAERLPGRRRGRPRRRSKKLHADKGYDYPR